MTWNELKAHIEVMDKEQRGTDVTILVIRPAINDDFYPVTGIDFSPEDDVLDKNHPFLLIDEVS